MARQSKPWYRKERDAWFVTIDGRRHNLGPDRKQAHQRFHELMAHPRRGTVQSDSLLAIIDAFLDWCQKHRSPDTYEWYRYRLQRFAERHTDLRTSELRPYHVENWADSYDFSVTSRRNYLRSVKRCMKWAKKQGYIESNPIADLEVPAADSKEVFIKQDEFEAFVEFTRDQTFHDLALITWETGCRPQESLRVEARHVDLANQRWVFPKAEAKNKRMPRIVYLTDVALDITRRLMFKYPQGPLFRNSLGIPWTTAAVNCGFIRVQIRMGKQEMKRRKLTLSSEEVEAFTVTLKQRKTVRGKLVEKTPGELRAEASIKLNNRLACSLAPKYSLYALRHSWATRALVRGVDPLTVAVLMGHKDPSTLAKVYQHLSHNPKHLLGQARKAAG